MVQHKPEREPYDSMLVTYNNLEVVFENDEEALRRSLLPVYHPLHFCFDLACVCCPSQAQLDAAECYGFDLHAQQPTQPDASI